MSTLSHLVLLSKCALKPVRCQIFCKFQTQNQCKRNLFHQNICMYIFSIFASSWNIATSLFYSCQFPISLLTMKNFWLLSIFCDGLFVAKVYPGLAFWYWYHRWCKPQCEHVFPRFFYSLQVTLIEIDRYFT